MMVYVLHSKIQREPRYDPKIKYTYSVVCSYIGMKTSHECFLLHQSGGFLLYIRNLVTRKPVQFKYSMQLTVFPIV